MKQVYRARVICPLPQNPIHSNPNSKPPRSRRCADSIPPPRRQSAFTLIEIMVVVIIIGILAAAIIPQFVGTTQDAKISAAHSAVAELENALERLNTHLDRYPTTQEGLQLLLTAPSGEEQKWRGPYIKRLRKDPWGNPYQYSQPGINNPATFDLWSDGPKSGGDDPGEKMVIGNWEAAQGEQ